MTKLVLASTSPARLRLLRDGGIEPITISPGVDEELLTEDGLASGDISNTQDMVLLLARAKAEAVLNHPDAQGALIIGCDSSLDLDGEALGKPHDPEVAIERWKSMRGRSGRLYTGHWLIDNRDTANPKAQGLATYTTVHFANLSDSEILAYVGTGEPLKVAGAFTIDGLGGAFIRAIEGDSHTVVGLSLSTLRDLCIKLGVDYPSLWSSK
ncbi:MAG: Maf family protein [Rhodoluna sp.]